MNNYKRYLLSLLGIFAVVFLSFQVIYPQFLTDVDKASKEKEEKSEAPQKEKELPPYIARNIKAVKLSNVKGAVRITWEVHADFDEDFIVGRTRELPYTSERALNASSIKVIPAVADSSIIDSGLPPGEYYYIILSKEKVKDRDVELYPDVNYTSVPIVIEKEIPSASYKVTPEQITLVHGMVINKTQVLLTWKGIESSGITYTIYRSNSQLNTQEKLKGAGKIAFITDGSESFVDRSIVKTENYYYAVTTKDLSGNEDLQLIPDQSYTASGVFVAFTQQNTVTNLKAQLTYGGSVKLTWNGLNFTSGDYLIYRGDNRLVDAERLALAKRVGSVGMDKTEYIDRKPGRGKYYYAVLVRQKDGTSDTTLVEASNYTVDPIRVGKMIRIRSVSAKAGRERVLIKWRYSGETLFGKYQIIRTESRIRKSADLVDGKIIDSIDVAKKRYIDDAPPAGKLYYAIVPEDFHKYKRFKLENGVNFTGPVYAKKGEDDDRDKDIEDVKEETANLTDIIRNYFFKAKYSIAIKKLENIISQSDNEYEIAKARLFIGRSWLELGRYNKALDNFLLPEVGKYFPDETRFWKEYAISRVR